MTGEKKYQVFISSTYLDLKKERQEAMHVVLKQNCIPAGMELFPAVGVDSWSLIRGIIDECDYYIVIVGGRYGSMFPSEDVSFTVKEYGYAMERKIPVLPFLCDFSPKTDEAEQEKLRAFRERLQQETTPNYCSTPQDLRADMTSSLAHAIRSTPAVGWVRGSLPHIETHARSSAQIRASLPKRQREKSKAEDIAAVGKRAQYFRDNISGIRTSVAMAFARADFTSDEIVCKFVNELAKVLQNFGIPRNRFLQTVYNGWVTVVVDWDLNDDPIIMAKQVGEIAKVPLEKLQHCNLFIESEWGRVVASAIREVRDG